MACYKYNARRNPETLAGFSRDRRKKDYRLSGKTPLNAGNTKEVAE